MNSDSAGPALPLGFRFEASVAGIKKSKKLDLSIIAGPETTVAAGVYTQNLVHATSIDWCRSLTPSDRIRGVVVNSGNANACTGEEGVASNRRLAAAAASVVGCEPEQVLVLSTGVIGKPLPIDKIEQACQAFPPLQSTEVAFLRAADGIMTTDVGRKVAFIQFNVGHDWYRIAVMAKGAGMIGPNMATMLAVAVTDFPLNSAMAQSAVQNAANASFNRISVEGHTSTNDAMLLLSSSNADAKSPDLIATMTQGMSAFEAALQEVCLECAKKIPADGEGATHLVEIRVEGAARDADADRIARAIANSALVKCAIHGNDPNWGRIVSAAGYANAMFDPTRTELRINGHLIFANGTPQSFNPADVSRSMAEGFEILILLSVGDGPGVATHFTSDLTVDYVRFNSEYTT